VIGDGYGEPSPRSGIVIAPLFVKLAPNPESEVIVKRAPTPGAKNLLVIVRNPDVVFIESILSRKQKTPDIQIGAMRN
jgi:hypothetical protein